MDWTDRNLVITADDFGRNDDVVTAVVQAFREGILTSASLVANSAAFEYAVSQAQDNPDLAVGVHLVVDEYPPTLPPSKIPSLVDSAGQFYPRRQMLWRIMSGQVNREELSLEWTAQLQKVVDAGLTISHLDGHGHCHVCPNVGRLVAQLADRFGVKVVRMSEESLLHFGDFNLPRYVEKVLLYAASSWSRRVWGKRVTCAREMFGFSQGGQLRKDDLDLIARSTRKGFSELVTHPSSSDRDLPHLRPYNSKRDLATLLAYSKSDFEAKFGVRLVPSHALGSAWR